MINQSTTTKLREMHLSAMAEALQDQVKDPAHKELSFEERLGLLVDAEWTSRKHNRLQKLIKQACLKFSNASIPDIEYHDDRKLDRSLILKLASCSYINENHNIIIMGASGNGKSWLACALGIAACQHYYPVKYIRLPELLDELTTRRIRMAIL
ncbi:MAG TPA: ATP-binding protein, partial [Candidatus Cloacimonadota bacterium]|nr:ATP-binding protein [Candidatus Cloacimonadota bacterium]